jgi:hypothetical protein
MAWSCYTYFMQNETWKPALIEVSSSGRVRICGKTIKPSATKRDGYMTVRVLVHRLVALGFHGEPPEDQPQVNHIDGDRQNNDPANLEWCSPGENAQRRVNGVRGCRHHGSKLTEEQVRQIYHQRPAMPPSTQQLAEQFGVSRHAIIAVRSGRNWAPDKGTSGRAILTREHAAQIRSYDYETPMRMSAKLALIYGVKQAVIQNIWNGSSYSSVTQRQEGHASAPPPS